MSSGSALIGRWVQEGSDDVTSVVYTIKARAGRLSVSGVDESDGVALRISKTLWDGRRLRFATLFPPTGHRAMHEFWLIGARRAKHTITYSDSDGVHSVRETWTRSEGLAKPTEPGMMEA